MGGELDIVEIHELERHEVKDFFKTHWGSDEMVISSGIFTCSELDGFLTRDRSGDINGLITYVIRQETCEMISLDSVMEGKGIGSALLHAVENRARNQGCSIIKLVTTNDNMRALSFYQKREYRLSRIIKDAVTEARKQKPEIPLIGYHGIPLFDEIELVKELGGNETK